MSGPRSAPPPEVSTGALVEIACLLEVVAPKAGNVHPAARFADTTWLDFALGAAAIAAPMDMAVSRPLGDTVRDCVRASRAVTGQNVHLGTILLIAPLASVPRRDDARAGVARVIARITASDARKVYEAIRLAAPGGLGTSDVADIRGPPPEDLLEAMRIAAARDLVARQYAGGFAEVFGEGVPILEDAFADGLGVEDSIVRLHLELMARYPDSLIARKCGSDVARESARRAREVLEAGWPAAAARARFAELDRWLRADGNQRNPGTSADLVAASLFLALRAGIIPLPLPGGSRPTSPRPP